MIRWSRLRAAAAVLGLLLAAANAGCVYYNTYYLARRYYQRSLDDLPYAVDKEDLSASPQFTNAITLSQKVLQNYPKSRYVDHAYLLWAKSLIGNDDPRQAIKLLEEFDDHYPKSSLLSEARFYLAVAYLRARKYERGLQAMDDFLAQKPKRDLVSYSQLERARTLLQLERPAEAEQAAAQVLAHTHKGLIATRARLVHAQALFDQHQYVKARADYHYLGRHSASDEDRLTFLLQEADCLEAAQEYGATLALLKDALAHEQEPQRPDTTGGKVAQGPTGPGTDHYGRILLRMGTVQLRDAKLQQALGDYNRVLQDYPRTPLGAEAQYRIGYAWETEGEDLDRARVEYGHVADQGQGTSFADQATTRIASLQQLATFKKATTDSVARQAESEFVLAEQFLFQADKPDRALDHYARVEQRFPDSPYAAKAMLATAWVYSRKLNRKAAADSLFWVVVRDHPATEAQLAARDYLEAEGVAVPDSLIKAPLVAAVVDSSAGVDTLTAPPPGSMPLGGAGTGDVLRLGPHPMPLALPPMVVPPRDSTAGPPKPPGTAAADSARRTVPGGAASGAAGTSNGTTSTNGGAASNGSPHGGASPAASPAPPSGSGAPADTSRGGPVPPNPPAPPTPAPRDTTHHAAPPDTTHVPAAPSDTSRTGAPPR